MSKIDTIINVVDENKISFSILNDGSSSWEGGLLKRDLMEHYLSVLGIGLIFNKNDKSYIIDALQEIIDKLKHY